MEIRTLEHTPLPAIVACFIKAFAGYFVKVSEDVNYYAARWKAAMVDFSSSYGMFDGEQLVGFVLHAVDVRFGARTAFNDGTGVLPAYRGRRIVQAIYEKAIPELKAKGIALLSLEVIRENAVALKAYEKVGFRIVKEYACFKGILLVRPDAAMQLEATTFEHMEWDALSATAMQAWEHQPESLQGGVFKYYYVWREGKRIGFFVIQPENGYLARLDAFTENEVDWNALLLGVSQLCNPVKHNNVDARQTTKIRFLEKHGLTLYINQFEMAMEI